MINNLKYILIFFIFFRCISQEKKLENGEWIQITVNKNDTVIYNPCYAENRKIIIKDNILVDHNGQEIISCKINSYFEKEGWKYIVLEKKCSYSDTIRYRSKNNIVEWELYNDVKFYSILSKFNKKFKNLDEVCDNEEIDELSNLNQLVKKWQGIYYNEPYIDSVGSYYVTINFKYLNFGFSGDNEFEYKIKPVENSDDSLFLYRKEEPELLGILIKKDNKFWIKSDLIENNVKNKENLFLLKYAKSASEVPDDK